MALKSSIAVIDLYCNTFIINIIYYRRVFYVLIPGSIKIWHVIYAISSSIVPGFISAF